MQAKMFFRPLNGLLNVSATLAFLLIGFAPIAQAVSPQVPATPPSASVSSSSVASSLEQDARLKHLVTIRAVGVTLDDLLHKLSTNGLILLADNYSGPQKLQIRLNRKPLSALMQSLAQLLPGSWLPRGDGSGYFFVMSKKAIDRRDHWWELFLKEQERAKEAQRKFILAKMHGRPVLHKIYHDSTDPANEMNEVNPKTWTQRKPRLQLRTLRLRASPGKGFPCPSNAVISRPLSKPKSL